MNKRKTNLKLAIIAILGFLLYYLLNLYTGFAIFCPFHKFTGLYCPGCGVTRLLFSLIKLDFYQAFRYNPLVFILLILGIIYWLIKIICQKFKNINLIIPNKIWYVLLIIVILFGIMRNIPFFDYLGPTNI